MKNDDSETTVELARKRKKALIEEYIMLEGLERQIFIPYGWYDTVEEMMSELVALDVPINILQIKEKFGGLRVYYESEFGTSVDKVVSKASSNVRKVCVVCGSTEDLTNGGWNRLCCPEHN